MIAWQQASTGIACARAAFCRFAAGLLQRKERLPLLPIVHWKENLVERQQL
jgi:hypothetical protein